MSPDKTPEMTTTPRLAGGDRLWAVLLAASAAMFAVQVDFFALQSAVPKMAADLGTSASDLQWVISGYMLAEAAFLIVGGRLADIFGRRRFLIVGAAIFGLTSLIGAAASGTVLTVLISVGDVALAVAASIYESYTSAGSPNQAGVILAIFMGAGAAVLIAALLVTMFGREPKSG